MLHFESLDGVSFENVWLTIGTFDGVHKGHQAILKQLIAGASSQGVPAVVLTFHPHPAIVLGNRQGPYYLTTPYERAELMGELGVDIVITYPFSRQVAEKSADEFVHELYQHLKMKTLLVGHDFALGKQRQGTPEYLAQLGQGYGFNVGIFEAVTLSDEIISSSLIRSSLAEGEVARVERMLGRPYRLTGRVIHGDGRGRRIGIPTANIELDPQRVLPAVGVYACTATTGDMVFSAVTNIGVRPTFKEMEKASHVEVHILDFKGDLYAKTLTIHFIERLRGEQKFPSAEALVAQINQDIQRTRAILRETNQGG